MNHNWLLLLFLISTIVYAESQRHVPHLSHIASLYLPKGAQLQAEHRVDRHTKQVHQVAQAQQHRKEPNNSLDIEKNQLTELSWGDTLMRMYFTNEGATAKATTPLNLIISGLKTFTALFDGIVNNGIYKLDKASPMQSFVAALLSEMTVIDSAKMKIVAREIIDIEINLLDTLKTSFIRQPLAAGRSINDLAIASITMLKGFAKSAIGSPEGCLQRFMCEANAECRNDIGESNIFCQIASFATSFILEKATGSSKIFYESGQRGRRVQDCQKINVECS